MPLVNYATGQVHFQTRTATSSFDRVTHNNRYDWANAGRSQRALSISTQ